MLDAGHLPPTSQPNAVEPAVLDGRTVNGRRVRELVAAFTAELGGNLPSLKADAVRRAAELSAIAEGLRLAHLAGDRSVKPGDVVKADNAADRARRQLRIGSAPTLTVRPIRERLRDNAA